MNLGWPIGILGVMAVVACGPEPSPAEDDSATTNTEDVPQDDVKPLVENRYEDFDAVRASETRRPASPKPAPKK